MSVISPSPHNVWEQAQQVRSRLTGPRWHQSFSGPVPLPSWLVDLVDGHMDAYVGPDPVLFRTAGVGLGWFTASEDHPDRVEVTDAHQQVATATLRSAADALADAGAIVDADVYVWGPDTPEGTFSVRVHRLFGVFTDQASVADVSAALAGIDSRFHQWVTPARVGVTAQITPRIAGAAWGV